MEKFNKEKFALSYMNLEQGDLVLCTVDRVEGTIVFVKISVDGKEIEGSIVTSEIAPGRIRNLRDYVVPKKKIVCKVLRISERGNVELSLRRVSPKEKKEVMDAHRQEMAYLSVLKKILGEKFQGVIEKIHEESGILDFFSEAKSNPKKLEKLVGSDSKKILEILGTERQKRAVIKKEISLKSDLPDGIQKIKKILRVDSGVEIVYIGSGIYSVKTESTDIKKAGNKIREVFSEIEKTAKENKVDFSIKEK